MSKMDTINPKILQIPQFFFHSPLRQAATDTNSGYGSDTTTVNYTQFCFRSDSFNVIDAPQCGRQIVKNVDKIMEIIESD